MSDVEMVLRETQPGLMLTPRCGAFVTGWLSDDVNDTEALEALRAIISEGNESAKAVVGVRAQIWTKWTGRVPAGAPAGDSILATNPNFRDTGGDVWLYLKGATKDDVDRLLKAYESALAPLLQNSEITQAALPADGKILDEQFADGFTSAGDPASLVTRVLQTDINEAPGSCWALAQRFNVAWAAFDDYGVEGQENVIGRDDNGMLIPDNDMRSHIKRVRVLDEDEANIELVRQALPFGPTPGSGGRERGIYFAAYGRSTDVFERLLANMIGGPEGGSDKLLGVVSANEGGYFYVPSATELRLASGLKNDDFAIPAFWKVRSDNGLMFYNSADYLNIMGTGKYAPGDPPSQRILGLMSKMFSRWQNKWYFPLDTPRMGTLADYLQPDEQHYLQASVPVRRGLSIQQMLTQVCTTTEYPVPRDSWAWRADVFRVDPNDILVGVMPELSLGRGKEVMTYLNDEERLAGFLVMLDETSSMGHVIPMHQRLLSEGIDAILADLQTRAAASGLSDDQKDFYQSAVFSLQGMQGYCLHYAQLAENMANDRNGHPDEQANLHSLAVRMRKLAHEKPETLVEAAQCIFTLHCCLHLVGEPVSIGRLDQLLWPFFEADATDPTAEAEAQEILDSLWVKLGEKALHNRQYASDHVTYGTTAVAYSGGNFPQGDGINQWVQQVTVGGYLPNDDPIPTPGANRLTLLCLRSARRLPLNAPVLSLRVYPGMDEEIVQEAAQALISGGSHPILFQEDRMTQALSQASGLPLEAARDYVCDGCYEPMVAGRSEFAFSNVTTLDALELALNEGARFNQGGPVYLRGWKLSFRSPAAAEITSFEELQQLYFEHLRYLTTQFFTGVLGNYGALWSYCPSPLLSVFVEGCVDSGRDLSNGGAQYHLLAPMFLGVATTIDSLYAIKKLVFDTETAVTTLPELVEALHTDWGFEMIEPFQSTLAGQLRSDERARRFAQIRSHALALPKFGMGDCEVDAIGEWLVTSMCNIATDILEKPAPALAPILQRLVQTYSLPDRPWKPTLQIGVGTFEAYVGDALTSGASADGRRNGQPFPSDFSPSPVPQDLAPIAQDPLVQGAVTGTNRPIYDSMSSWNKDVINTRISNAAPVDLNVREDFPVEDAAELIRQYAAGNVGSNLITITVADPDTYEVAAGQPEQYELVRVRMGGWTEYFSAMFPAHHAQHRRRPFFLPQEPPEGCIGKR